MTGGMAERSREAAVAADDESEEAWMAMALGTDAIVETQPDISAYPREISVPDTSETTPMQAFAMPTGEQWASNSLSVEIRLKDSSVTACKPCLLAKAKKKPISTSRSGTRPTKFGELVYSGVLPLGPIKALGHPATSLAS
jgi:hypothetical protein